MLQRHVSLHWNRYCYGTVTAVYMFVHIMPRMESSTCESPVLSLSLTFPWTRAELSVCFIQTGKYPEITHSSVCGKEETNRNMLLTWSCFFFSSSKETKISLINVICLYICSNSQTDSDEYVCIVCKYSLTCRSVCNEPDESLIFSVFCFRPAFFILLFCRDQ